MAISEINQNKITYYKDKMRENFALAYIAAVPLLLSPDLLYKLWRNFSKYSPNTPSTPTQQKEISHLAVSDLLLSSLCRPVGFELYKMEEEIRLELLKAVKRTDKEAIAKFLEEYAQKTLTPQEENIQKIHLSTAKSILHPEEFVNDIKNGLLNAQNTNLKKSHLLDLYFQLEEGDGENNGLSLVLKPTEERGEGVVEIERRLVPKQVLDRLPSNEKNSLSGNLQLLKTIEEQLNISLQEIDLESIMRFQHRNTYTLDENGEIIGLNLSKNGIENIIFISDMPNLQRLNLTENNIKDISTLSNLHLLERLELAKNKIRDIGPLQNLIRLQYLTLNKNQIKDITAFQNLTKLKLLHLGGNNISDTSPLGNSVELIELGLGASNISDISFLSNLINLERVKIDMNNITDISPLEKLVNLENLKLQYNKILYFPSNFFDKHPYINELYLYDNPIENIPKEIIGRYNCMIELKEYLTLNTSNRILLKGGNLKTVPNYIRENKSIQVLDLSNNQIEELPEWIGELTNLKELRMRSNLINAIPNSIGNLLKLDILDLGLNQLKVINPNIGKLENLHLLVLENNPIEEIGEIFTKLQNLKLLYMANTYKLSKIPDSIGNCKKLMGLFVDNNKLSSLPLSLQKCEELSSICLHNNLFEELPSWIFDFEKITKVDTKNVQIFTAAKDTLYLAGNPIIDILYNQEIDLKNKTILELKEDILNISGHTNATYILMFGQVGAGKTTILLDVLEYFANNEYGTLYCESIKTNEDIIREIKNEQALLFNKDHFSERTKSRYLSGELYWEFRPYKKNSPVVKFCFVNTMGEDLKMFNIKNTSRFQYFSKYLTKNNLIYLYVLDATNIKSDVSLFNEFLSYIDYQFELSKPSIILVINKWDTVESKYKTFDEFLELNMGWMMGIMIKLKFKIIRYSIGERIVEERDSESGLLIHKLIENKKESSKVLGHLLYEKIASIKLETNKTIWQRFTDLLGL